MIEVSPGGAAPIPTPLEGFAGLTTAEKILLKKLWSHQQFGSAPGKRWGVSVPPGAANSGRFETGRDLLLARKWVGFGKRGMIVLTDAGIEFVRRIGRSLTPTHCQRPRRASRPAKE